MALEQFDPALTLDVQDYEPYVGQERIDQIKKLAEGVEGKGWANVNSTFMGGGVAEILQSLVPMARGLGVDAKWFTIRGTDEFFRVTKKFHNMLQGMDFPISLEEIFGAYLDTIDENARNTFIASDLVEIHDPQPAGLIMNGAIYGNVIWRCHIDTSRPNPVVWRFLLPYINNCSGTIFTMPEFVGQGLQVPIYEVAPCIDPRSEKNVQYTEKKALEILSPLFESSGIDPERPIIAAISRYDPHKNQATILEAFRVLRKEKKFKTPPYLIFLGNTATDDPEGGAMLTQLKELAGSDPDVRFWVNVENNDQVVGALMKHARFFVHVSTREGFGLVVSEAMWQGTPVIGSMVGGIRKQVIDGQTGFLVEPKDTAGIARAMGRLLDNPDEAVHLGSRAREHVRTHFLMPELLRKYLLLLRFYTGVDNTVPDFRLNELSYSELFHSFRRPHPELPSAG